ncbi:MAG: acyl-phosphate glycerol 3-phosphate acyltransferase [Caulobacteraceae bacterium]|nr:acyl-phosphate glycerol 3-phosphate acyltransferase [Caulobacteraceae bacterium]
MNKLRSALFAAWFLGGSTLLAFLYFPSIVMPRSVIRRLIRFWGIYVETGLKVICGIRIEVRGREHMPTGAALIAAKHQSMLDVTGEFTLLPDSCFVMKQELLNIPLFGWYCLKVGMVPLDRAGSTAALKQMVADVRERFGEARQVVIFPEGTRTPPGQTGTYKPGVAALYRELNMPCHLVATNSGVHWAKGFSRKPGVVVFEYLPPLPAGLKRGEFMREIEERIETASKRLLEEGI